MRGVEQQGKSLCPGGIVSADAGGWGKLNAANLKRIRNIAALMLVVGCLVLSLTASLDSLILWLGSIALVAIMSWYAQILEVKELKKSNETIQVRPGRSVDQTNIKCNNALMIGEICNVLNRESDIDGILSNICTILEKRLEFDRGLVMTINGLKNGLDFKAGYGYSDDQLAFIKDFDFRLDDEPGKEIFVKSFHEKRVISTCEADRIDQELACERQGFVRDMKVVSMICCPIVYEDESLGILATEKNRHGEALQRHEIDVLKGVASQIGSRMHNIRLEEQLRQSQKMEAVGMLAGGVAHDFANILTTIIGNSELIAYQLHDEHPLNEKIADIRQAGEKAADLTDQLVSFCRKQSMELKVVDLNLIVEDMGRMLRRMIGEDIELEFITDKKFINIKADVGQIEQILMNMAVNARDAMPNGGLFSIETSETYLDGQYSRTHLDVEPGKYAVLTVTDTGVGMNRKIQSSVFEPFFTTKEKGKGTGLGLATVYGIVKQLDGHIYVYSELEKGTTFKVFFPLIIGPIFEIDEHEETIMPNGTEGILVVDDDDSIRKLVVDTLEPLGYTLLEAEDGEAALALVLESNRKIDLVLSDVIMPGLNGRQLIERVREDRPGIKTVLMSGYTDNIIERQGAMETGSYFISKPLRPILLANKIRSALDETTAN